MIQLIICSSLWSSKPYILPRIKLTHNYSHPREWPCLVRYSNYQGDTLLTNCIALMQYRSNSHVMVIYGLSNCVMVIWWVEEQWIPVSAPTSIWTATISIFGYKQHPDTPRLSFVLFVAPHNQLGWPSYIWHHVPLACFTQWMIDGQS